MIDQAIPVRGIGRFVVARSSVASASGWYIVVVMCVMLAGCAQKTSPTVVAPKSTAGSGGGLPKGDGPSGRNTILQMPFDNAAKLVMANIGYAYKLAIASNGKSPRDAAELGAGQLKTKRDMEDREIEILYGVDLKQFGDDPGSYMIAWEKTPTSDGYRLVLMADLQTVKSVSQEEFEKMKKAK